MTVVVVCCDDSGNARNTTEHGECSVYENAQSNFIEILLKKTEIKSKYAG